MVIIDLTRNLYFASPPPWAKRSGVVVKHKPHQSSPALKAWQRQFGETAKSLRGTRGRAPNGLPAIADAIGNRLSGRAVRATQ